MKAVGWSLRNRIRLVFTLVIAVVIAAVAGTSLVYLQGSLQRELSALCSEEMEELRAHYLVSGFDQPALTKVVEDLQESHGANPMGWRFWRRGAERPWELGAPGLLKPAGLEPPAVQPAHRIADDHWRTVQVLDDDLTVELVLDGSAQVAFLRRYESFTGLLILVGALLAFGAANLVASRISTQLTAVAERARKVQLADEAVQLHREDSPEEIREVSEALAEMYHSVRREHEDARMLVAGLAHELRSPIQNLVGETEVTLLAERPAEEYRRVLTSHLEELQDLGHAVDNLVTLCSGTQPFTEHPLEEFDLGREARLRLEREEATAERRGITVTIEQDGDLRLRADREAVLRAVRNLVANAVEWSPEGGHVEVELAGCNGVVRITVDDRGPGVSADQKERIFEPFYRGPAAAGRRMGFGLGLALARSAATARGGSLVVEDSPFGGARFILSLPRD